MLIGHASTSGTESAPTDGIRSATADPAELPA